MLPLEIGAIAKTRGKDTKLKVHIQGTTRRRQGRHEEFVRKLGGGRQGGSKIYVDKIVPVLDDYD